MSGVDGDDDFEDEPLFTSVDVGAPDLAEPDYISSAYHALQLGASPDAGWGTLDPPGEQVELIGAPLPHPAGPWQIIHARDDQWELYAQVRGMTPGPAIWQPDAVTQMAWLRDGREIGVMGYTFTPGPTKPTRFQSPWQSEFTYWFERWTWPDRTRLSHCPVTMRTGWPSALLAAPDPSLVFMEWQEQSEDGFEVIHLDDLHSDWQDILEHYEVPVSVLGPYLPVTVSPHARYLVRCQTRAILIADDAWVGTRPMADLMVIDRVERVIRQIPVSVELPAGWTLSEEHKRMALAEFAGRRVDGRAPWVITCAFSDEHHVRLEMIDGANRIIDVVTGASA